jgi:hypothetical protein
MNWKDKILATHKGQTGFFKEIETLKISIMTPENLKIEQIQLLIDFLNSCAYAGEKFDLSNEILVTVKAREILESIEKSIK